MFCISLYHTILHLQEVAKSTIEVINEHPSPAFRSLHPAVRVWRFEEEDNEHHQTSRVSDESDDQVLSP